MPTYSSAIADGLPEPQRPQATPPRRPRAKEFWEIEPGDPEASAWSDNPNTPTEQPTPVQQQQEAIQNMQVVVTKEQPKKIW